MEQNKKALKIAVTAVFAALLTVGKTALAFVPNVEVVTLLVALCSFVWGFSFALPAVVVFCAAETVMWGFNTWVLEYLIYWPLVAGMFSLLGRSLKSSNTIVKTVAAAVTAAVLTFIFGAFTTLIDTLIFFSPESGFGIVSADFLYRYAVMYSRGAVFFLTHIVSNTVLFAAAFPVLSRTMTKIKTRLFPVML